MAEDVYISGLGPGVPQWSNEATQLQVLNALNSGFNSNVQVNRQIIATLSNIYKDGATSSSKLSDVLKNSKETESAIKSGNNLNSAENKKQTGILATLINLFSESNRTAKQQLDIAKRIETYEKQGLATAEATLRASFDAATPQSAGSGLSMGAELAQANAEVAEKGLKKEDKGVVETVDKLTAAVIAGTYSAVTVTTAETLGGATERYNMAQEMRQSGILAGMDAAGAGLIGLSKTISRSNFTFGEAAHFTRQFSQAVGVRGVEASMQFANTLAKSGEGNSDMMQRFGMEFSEVTEIAGTYMESLRSIGQLDKLSDNQMRLGMDNFMDTVVSTSNVMKINLQDAANMIADTLKQDRFASQLALMEPEMRKNVEAMVGSFGGQGNPFAEGLATAMAAGSTQDFLQTDVAQQLQGDVIGQQLLPLITQMADTARTQGPDAANALYASMGPQFEAILAFIGDNKALVNMNEGMAQTIAASAAKAIQTIGDANKGIVPLADEDKEVNRLFEVQRFDKLTSEANTTLVLQATNLSNSLNQLVDSSLILTRELAELGATSAKIRGGVGQATLEMGAILRMTAAGFVVAGEKAAAKVQTNAGVEPFSPTYSYDATSPELLGRSTANNPTLLGKIANWITGEDPNFASDKEIIELRKTQEVIAKADFGKLSESIKSLVEVLGPESPGSNEDKISLAEEIKNAFKSMFGDDSYMPGNYFNSDKIQKQNSDIDKLITEIRSLVNKLE